MNPRIVIDLQFVKAVLAEFGIHDNNLQAISDGNCRLECRLDKAVVTTAKLECIGFEPLSCNRQDSSTAVIWFRVMGLKS